MLHTLHRSPWLTDFAALLRLLSEGDELLLLQDGVTAAVDGNRYLESLRNAPIILISSDLRLSTPARWPGDGGIVVYFLTPFRHRPKIRRPHIV